MNSSRLGLPPLNALRTFEAAARHGSFKAAAEELCVTQAAVSRQIQTLETFYGLKLFIRGNRTVELTEEGQTLQLAASPALQNLAAVSRDLLRRHSQGYLSLVTTTAFGQLWFMPRFKMLNHQYPDLQLHLISGEGNASYREGFDAAIMLGLEEHPQYVAEYLFSEEIFPVCTPGFLEQHPHISTLAGLLDVTLLNLSAGHWKARLWTPLDWDFWLGLFGIDGAQKQKEMNFSHFTMLLDAVYQEVGVGLAWRHLVQQQLEEGRLVRPVKESYDAQDRKHYFVCRRERANSPEMQILRDWLMAQTQELRA
ncbi:LysR substrate-binding domain-containing protein [Halomonas organivorans]|uniref:DNA-binding transcriptional LysR family regulator n=1 Tax=Halomonas organivorans TaxID=257772 RepID=A0A7W5G492_9GAMM|nr:LysR substrate-binding domain-containing protein [Halomonas organivorans]MBB3139712.1 DNA-binding transcriptional LysR family regulator [Halomonas organivorans]